MCETSEVIWVLLKCEGHDMQDERQADRGEMSGNSCKTKQSLHSMQEESVKVAVSFLSSC